MPRPSYPLFDHLARLDLVVPRAYDLEYHGAWSVDFVSLERAWTPRTRAVLVVSPNNPTGSFLKQDELDRLAAMCAAARRGDHRRRGVRRLRARTRRGSRRGSRRPARRGADVFARRALEVGGPAAGQARVDRGRRTRQRSSTPRSDGSSSCATRISSVSTPVQLAASELLAAGAADPGRDSAGASPRTIAGCATVSPARRRAACCAPKVAGTRCCRCRRLERRRIWSSISWRTDGVLVHPGYFFDFRRESFLILSLLPPRNRRFPKESAASCGISIAQRLPMTEATRP